MATLLSVTIPTLNLSQTSRCLFFKDSTKSDNGMAFFPPCSRMNRPAGFYIVCSCNVHESNDKQLHPVTYCQLICRDTDRCTVTNESRTGHIIQSTVYNMYNVCTICVQCVQYVHSAYNEVTNVFTNT